MNKHAGKSVDPSKALTVPANVPIADPYTKTYEERMTTTDLLELESTPAIMFTHVKGKHGRTVLPTQTVDPYLHQKRSPYVAATTGRRSIPLELDVLNLDQFPFHLY